MLTVNLAVTTVVVIFRSLETREIEAIMPLPTIVEVTLQAALMNVFSNVLAQYIESMKDGVRA